jgi:hypothetical protein
MVGAGTYFVTDDGLLPFDQAMVPTEEEEEALTAPEQPGELPAPPIVDPAGELSNEPAVDNLDDPPKPTDEPEPVETERNEAAIVEEEEPDDEDDQDPKKKPIDEKAARNEVYKFMRWVRKNPTGLFSFEHLPETYAATLNKFVAVEDYEGARWYAERYLA